MEIVAALFVEAIDFRKVEGDATRIDITGAFFSTAVPSYPAQLTPHLVVLVRAAAGTDPNATLETVLVRGELEFPGPGTVEARCTIVESGSAVTVPLTALPTA